VPPTLGIFTLYASMSAAVTLIICGAIWRVKCLLWQNLLKIYITLLVVCSLHMPKIKNH